MKEDPKELLREAATYLSEWGHTKGQFGCYGGPVCADGALGAVALGEKYDVDNFLDDGVYSMNAVLLARQLLAKRVIEDGGEPGADTQETIWSYNDAKERTAEDVILMLKRAGEGD